MTETEHQIVVPDQVGPIPVNPIPVVLKVGDQLQFDPKLVREFLFSLVSAALRAYPSRVGVISPSTTEVQE